MMKQLDNLIYFFDLNITYEQCNRRDKAQVKFQPIEIEITQVLIVSGII